MTRNRGYPRAERSGLHVQEAVGMDRKQRVLPCIVGRRARKTPHIVAKQPHIQFPEQLLINVSFAVLCRHHKTGPPVGTSLQILVWRRPPPPSSRACAELGAREILAEGLTIGCRRQG